MCTINTNNSQKICLNRSLNRLLNIETLKMKRLNMKISLNLSHFVCRLIDFIDHFPLGNPRMTLSINREAHYKTLPTLANKILIKPCADFNI